MTTDSMPAAPASRRLLVALGFLITCVMVLLATSVVLHRHHKAAIDEAPIAVGKQEALNFFTLNYQHIDANLAAVTGLATNPFKAQFAAKAASIKAGVVAKQLSVSASTPTNAAGLEYERGGIAIVMVAVDETITAPSQAAQTNHYRMRLHLVKVNGQWLVSQVQQVG